MGWILLLLLVVAGRGQGIAATAAAALPRHRHQQNSSGHYHRYLLQDVGSLRDGGVPCNTTEMPGCSSCVSTADEVRCEACDGSLLLLRNLNACGCPAGTFAAGVNTCRDCPKGSFCLGGRYNGEDNNPPATPCSVFSAGLTTLGSRTTRKEGCVNLPGYSYELVGPDNDPRANPCPADTYQFGLRKQRACVPCPPGLGTENKTMQTSVAACDVDACLTTPCGKNMDCFDLPRPALSGVTGRQCKCVPGTTYVDDLMGCSDPSETPMIGGPHDRTRLLSSFELRCPRGTFIVAVSGMASTEVHSIGPLTCSDGTGTPLGSFGTRSGSTFTTAIAPDGFTGMTVTADRNIASLEFIRKDGVLSVTYGTFADYTSQNGRRQFLTCPSFGVATGIVGVKGPDGTPVMLGFLCSGLPCSVRQDTMFGPAGAGQLPNSPAGYLQNSPEPTTTTTATQCCGACTHDFKCQFWVREDSTGNCWLVYREPTEPGRGIPADWAFQSVPGYQSGTTQPKTSGISVSGSYMGCFREASCAANNRMQASLAVNVPDMTVKKCLELALMAGWTYGGLAPGTTPGTTSCYGGDKLSPTTVNPGCFAPCSGNSSERCGDNNCMVSVYSVLKPRWPLAVLDTGDPTRQGAGWYDVQCQGALNDYCRWVGRGNDSYFSCALAGKESPYTLPGQITEQFANSAPCQETGYRSQALTDLTCISGDLSQPWDNNCRNRQCCKAKCDGNPACTGFVFGNSPNNDCRTAGDGQNCCWLKGGECRSVFNPLMSAWQKASPVSCSGFPADPANGVMFCPDNGRDPGNWVQGTTCVAECLYGIAGSDQKPYAVCLSNGQWSDTVGLCKPACSLPPLLCP